MTLRSATLYLVRDAAGHANWQWTNPDEKPGATDFTIVRHVSIDNAHVSLDDERRHLKFDGTVSADNNPGSEAPLRIGGEGRLNGRAASFEITGDALAGASHELPYHFSFIERSGGSQIAGKGLLPHPFDFDLIDTAFEASGPDLKDLYFLVGVTLIDTGGYRLSGSLKRRGNLSKFSDLSIASGQSDARGTLSIDSSGERPLLDVDLKSQVLRTADLGARAAGRASAGEALMLSDAQLNPETLRRADARISFHAGRVEVGRLSLEAVSAKGTVDHGVLTVAPLLGGVFRGKFQAHLTLDAKRDPPAADAEIKIENLQLGDIPRKASGAAPLEGPLDARIKIAGRGSSIHQVAASGNGTVTAVVPQGTIRDSLAELTGIDLRGLGLLLAKDQRETTLRCAVASFTERDGTLSAQRLIVGHQAGADHRRGPPGLEIRGARFLAPRASEKPALLPLPRAGAREGHAPQAGVRHRGAPIAGDRPRECEGRGLCGVDRFGGLIFAAMRSEGFKGPVSSTAYRAPRGPRAAVPDRARGGTPRAPPASSAARCRGSGQARRRR